MNNNYTFQKRSNVNSYCDFYSSKTEMKSIENARKKKRQRKIDSRFESRKYLQLNEMKRERDDTRWEDKKRNVCLAYDSISIFLHSLKWDAAGTNQLQNLQKFGWTQAALWKYLKYSCNFGLGESWTGDGSLEIRYIQMHLGLHDVHFCDNDFIECRSAFVNQPDRV